MAWANLNWFVQAFFSMKIEIVGIICFSIARVAFCQEIIIDRKQDVENIINRDSLGNLLTLKQVHELLKTGKYISVPSLNSSSQIERIIRKPRKEDGNRYKTYAYDDKIISTTGLDAKTKLGLGDSLPPFKVKCKAGTLKTIEELKNEFSLLMIRDESQTTWKGSSPHIELLIDDYPNVNYIFCNQNESKKLEFYFSSKFQRAHQNIYTADFDISKNFQGAPWYVLINKKRRIEIFIPPLPNETIAIQAIKKMLDRTNQ